MAKCKRTNNNLQCNTNKTKYRVTRTPLKSGSELRCSGRVSSSCSTSDTRRVTVKGHERFLEKRYNEIYKIYNKLIGFHYID
jgi:hypothetical protein